MPIQYGQYNLANSQRVKPFAGSALPELTSVAGTMQERYDKALEQEDMLARATRIAQAAPFAGDQQLLGQLRQEFKDRINQRSMRGDYENMYRDTMLDARNFMDRYQPLAENAQRFQQYQAQLQDNLAKGVIKDPEKARKLLALSTQSYQGMTYDPVTGQYTNKFQGMTPVKDIDPTEKIDKWMKDVAPTVLGKKIRYVDGLWMKEEGGKTTTLTSDEIQQVITAGRRLDPEFNAWMHQEKQLATADVRNLSTEDIQQMADGPVKQAIMASMNEGVPPTEAAKRVMGTIREQGVYGSMQQYANKYIRDDREVEYGPTGPNQYELQRQKKKLDDESLVLSMPILQPEIRAEVQGAEDMLDKVKQSGAAAQTARQHFDDWKRTEGLRPDGKGSWVDAQGNDKTLKYLEQEQVYKQAERGLQNLRQLEAEARRRTGYNPEKSITPALLRKAEEAGQAAVNTYRARASSAPGGFTGASITEAEAQQIKQQAKAEYLRTHSPGYEQYDKTLKDMTAKGAQLINAQTFNSESANKQATNLFKNFVLNLDANGLNSGTQGLVWASGDATGEPLEGSDYKKVVADATFAGWAMDTDGQLKYFYNVGSVKQNSKGKLVGEQALVKMPALPGTMDILIKNKQIDPAQILIGQRISETINTPAGQGYIDVGNGNKIFVDRIDKTEIGKSEVGAGINLRFPAPGGTYTERRVGSTGEAINKITDVIYRSLQKQKQ